MKGNRLFWILGCLFLVLGTSNVLGGHATSSDSHNLSEWRMDGRNLNGTHYYPGPIPSNISQLSTTTYSAGANTDDPVVVGGFLYAGPLRVPLVKLNSSNITQLIDQTADHNVFRIPVAPVWDTYVYGATESGTIYQYNKSNLSQVIATNSDSNAQHYSSPIVYNEYVYFSDWHSTGGNAIFQANATNVTQVINSYAVGACESAPVVDNGFIYYGCGSNRLIQLNASNVSIEIAIYTAGGAFDTGHGMAVARPYVYFGTTDDIVYQVNASNVSNLIATFTTNGDTSVSPAVAHGYVYAGSQGGHTYQLNASNISIHVANFSTGPVYYGLTVTDDYLLVGGSDLHQLNAFNISESITNYSVSTPFTPVIVNGIIYFASGNSYYQLGTDKPVSDLLVPRDYYELNATTVGVTFNCSGFDTTEIVNISLYITDKENTSFALNQSANRSGQSNYSNWTLQLDEGNYTWNCLIFDTDGNSDWYNTNRSIVPDTVNPSVIIDTTNNTNTTDTSLDVEYTVVDSNLHTCWYSNDSYEVNSTLANCVDITTITWSDGQHNVTIYANDTKNNIGSTSVSFTIDNTNPSITLNSPEDAAYNDTFDPINISFNCTGTDNSGLANISLYITNNSNDSFALNQTTTLTGTNSSANWTLVLPIGNYTWGCNVADLPGTANASENRSLKINFSDTTAPVFTNIVNDSVGENKAFALKLNATDNYGFSCFSVNDTTNFQIDCSGNLINNTLLEVRVYDLNITINDTGNNNKSSLMFVNVTYVGAIELNVTYPTIDINATQNQLFNVTVNVSCGRNDCGEINVTLNYVNVSQSFFEDFEDTSTWSTSTSNSDCANNGVFDGCDSKSSDYDFYLDADQYSGTYALLLDDWDTFDYDAGLWDNITPAGDCDSNTCEDYKITFYDHNYGLDSTEYCIVWLQYSNGTNVNLYNCTDGDSCDDGTVDASPEANDYVLRTINLTDEGIDLNDTEMEIHLGAKIDGSADYCFWDEFKIEGIKNTFTPNDSLKQNVSLNVNQSTVLTWYLNASGKNNDTHILTVFANRTNDLTISNATSPVNVTILNGVTSPTVVIDLPINNTNSSYTLLNVNYTATSSNLDVCWYSNDSYLVNTTLTCGDNITSIAWSEGQHNVTVWANDTSGGESSAFVTFTIDTMVPQLSISTPMNNTNSSYTSLNVNYTVSDLHLVTCWYSNDSYQVNTTLACGSNLTSITWSEGQHNVTIYVNDTASNENSTSITFTIDTNNPQISIVVPVNNTNTSNTGVHVNYTVSDNAVHSCWYSNDSYASNSSLTNCSTNITSITWSEGEHNLTVFVNDSSGNENSTTITFIVDTIKPGLNINYPRNNTNSTNTGLNVNYSYSDMDLHSCWYSNDSYLANTTLSNCSTNLTSITWSEGSHSVRVWANDTSGNVNGTSILFFVDLSAPNTPILVGPSPDNNENSSNTSWNFNWSVNDSADNSLLCNITIDNEINVSNVVTLNGSYTNYTIFGFNESNHTWKISCWDDVNLSNSSVTRSFTVSAPDNDGDGIIDRNDTLHGNETYVNVSGNITLNITVGGNTTAGTFDDVLDITIRDGEVLLANFTHNFTNSSFNLSDVYIEVNETVLMFNFSGQLQGNKTVFFNDSGYTGICVKDIPLSSANISSECDQDNESDFSSCIGVDSGTTLNEITCYDEGRTFRFENVQNTAVRGKTVATVSSTTTSSGGGGRSTTIIKIPIFSKTISVNMPTSRKYSIFTQDKHSAMVRDLSEEFVLINIDGVGVQVNIGEHILLDLDEDSQYLLKIFVIEIYGPSALLDFTQVLRPVQKKIAESVEEFEEDGQIVEKEIVSPVEEQVEEIEQQPIVVEPGPHKERCTMFGVKLGQGFGICGFWLYLVILLITVTNYWKHEEVEEYIGWQVVTASGKIKPVLQSINVEKSKRKESKSRGKLNPENIGTKLSPKSIGDIELPPKDKLYSTKKVEDVPSKQKLKKKSSGEKQLKDKTLKSVKSSKKKLILAERKAIALLKKYAPNKVVFKAVAEHSKVVQKVALRFCKDFDDVDADFVKIASLLHDIGRFKCPPGKEGIWHGIMGSEILRKEGLDEKFSKVCERHIGAGISKDDIEQQKLDLPVGDYIPVSIEEKIIAHADNLVFGVKEVKFDKVVQKFRRRVGDICTERVIRLHDEIESFKNKLRNPKSMQNTDKNVESTKSKPSTDVKVEELSSEQIKQDMETGEKEADVYSEEGREELEENDEITPEEEGFSQGEQDGEDDDLGGCSECGMELNKENFVKKEIRGNLLHFCSTECLKAFDKKEEKTEIIWGDEEESEKSDDS